MPINQADIIKSAVELSTITSKETALRYLPASILPDGVEDELEKIEESKPNMDVGAIVEPV